MLIFPITAAVIVTLLLIPIRVHMRFDDDLTVKIKYGFFSFRIFPRKEKPEKTPEADKKTSKRPSVFKKSLTQDGFVETIRKIGGFARIALEKWKTLCSHIKISPFVLKIAAADEDAAETAKKHAQLCAVVYPLLAAASAAVRIPKRDIMILPRFDKTESQVYFFAVFRLSPIFILPLTVLLFQAIKALKPTGRLRTRKEGLES